MENKQFEEEKIIKGKIKPLTDIIGKHLIDNKFSNIEAEVVANFILTQCWQNGPATIESMEDIINRISRVLRMFVILKK